MAGTGGGFVTDLGIVLMVAALALLFVRTLRQPLILGYLVAGILVGPHGLAQLRIVEVANVETMAELGILFIMVSLGLEFNPRKLRAIGAVAFAAAVIQILTSFAIGAYLARHMGLSTLEGAFIAGGIAISSTLVAVKVLQGGGELDSPHGRLAVGILLVQDVVSVAFLAVVGGLQATGGLAFEAAATVLGGLGVFTLAALIFGALVAPRFIHFAAKASEELLLIVLLGIAFGVSLLAVHFGFSIALGAFIVGAIIAETKSVEAAERLVQPLRDMFTAVFFVSIGMLIEPRIVLEEWRLVVLISVIVIVTRALIIPLPAFLFGARVSTGMRAGASISQVGEFSFIILASGIALGVVDGRYLAVFTGVAGLTTLLTPYTMKAVDPTIRLANRIVPAPIRTYAQVYGDWMTRLSDAEETARHRRREVEILRRILLNVVALVALGGITFLAWVALRAQTIDIGGRAVGLEWGVWAGAVLLATPSLVTIWKALRELAVEVVLELVPDRLANDPSSWPVRTVRTSMTLFLALGVGAASIAVLPEFGAGTYPVLAVVLLIVVAAAALFWRQVSGLHGHVERTITDLFGTTTSATVDRDEVLKTIGIHYSISLGTESIKVTETSPIAFHSIQRGQIRNKTGATIVCIDRQDGRIVNPDPAVILRPGDQLLLMGERHHLEKARELVAPVESTSGEARELGRAQEPVKVREMTLPDSSPVAGRSLAMLSLRSKTGASLVAAIRDSEHIQNPAPGFQLRAGDRLFLFGTTAHLDKAEAYLATGDPLAEDAVDRFRKDVGPVGGMDLPAHSEASGGSSGRSSSSTSSSDDEPSAA